MGLLGCASGALCFTIIVGNHLVCTIVVWGWLPIGRVWGGVGIYVGGTVIHDVVVLP